MLNVLYVDEDASPLEPIKLLLEMTAEMKVEVAQNIPDGFARAMFGGMDVIVFGCRKGDTRCVDFIRSLRRNGSSVPLVMFADAFSEKLKNEVLKWTGSAFLYRENNPTRELLLLTDEINRLTGNKTI